MNKIILIIQREYLSRVKKKSFLWLTFLVPLLFIGMIAVVSYVAVSQNELGELKKVEVVDESGTFAGKLLSKDNIQYTFVKDNIATAKTGFLNSGYDYLLYIPASIDNAQLIAEKKPAAIVAQTIERELSNTAQSTRLAAAHIDSAIVAIAQKPINVERLQVTEAGIQKAHTAAAAGVGFVCAFLIYFALFLYGSQVMRGVIEEKVSRIVEVVISSVKPFQLMLGKIIGVGLVGLTQFVLWIVLTLVLSTGAGGLMMKKMNSMQAKTEQVSQMQQQSGSAGLKTEMQSGAMGSIMEEVSSIPVAFTIACFLFYFVFGYLLYSALFAAVGSAVDSETETQQFMVPVTLPLIFTFMMAQSTIVNNPDSSLAVWLSIIPFTSPIAMMMRIPFGGVPAWQLATSMVLMVLGFLFTTWVAGRIYRVGILMYGKKASYKELVKWFSYRD